MKTLYDFETEIDDVLDDALNELSQNEYEKLLDYVTMSLADHGYGD